jgi:VRR-NUC domain
MAGPRTADAVLSEEQFQAQVVELARMMRWRTMHVRRTIGKGRKWTTGTSVNGWPDLTLWRPGQFLMVECKTDIGKVTDEQLEILHSLHAAGVDARIWRPRDWDEVQATLTAALPSRRDRSLPG